MSLLPDESIQIISMSDPNPTVGMFFPLSAATEILACFEDASTYNPSIAEALKRAINHANEGKYYETKVIKDG